MASVDRLLADDEDIVADLRPHPLFFVAPLVVVLAAAAGAGWIGASFPQAPVAVGWVLAAMVAIPAVWLLGRVLRWRAIRLLVTSSRIVYRRGVLRRDIVQLRLQRVADVHCSQTLIDRLLGAGRLVFEVAGDAPLAVDDVRRPRAVQRAIAEQLDQLERVDERLQGPGGSAALQQASAAMAPGAAAARWGPDPTAPVILGRPGPLGAGVWDPGRPTLAAPRSDETPPQGTPPAPHRAGVSPDAVTGPLPVVAASTPRPPSHDGEGPSNRSPIPERLIALDDLHRRGIITDEEFAAKKAELLSRF